MSYSGTFMEAKNNQLLIKWLEQNGHTCVKTGILWCKSPFCNQTYTKDIMRINNTNENFGYFLEQCGHTCLMVIDSTPITISWCESSICINK